MNIEAILFLQQTKYSITLVTHALDWHLYKLIKLFVLNT